MSKAQCIMSKTIICPKIWCYYGTHSTIKIHICIYLSIFNMELLPSVHLQKHAITMVQIDPPPPPKKEKKNKTKHGITRVHAKNPRIPRIKIYITVRNKHDYQGKCHKNMLLAQYHVQKTWYYHSTLSKSTYQKKSKHTTMVFLE